MLLQQQPRRLRLVVRLLFGSDCSVPGFGVAEYCDGRVCLSFSVCLSVCPRAYLRNYTSDLYQACLHVTCMAVARSSSGGVAIHYVLPVLWMTSYLHIMVHMAVARSSSGGKLIPLWRVTLLRRRAHDNASAASYWLRGVLDDCGAETISVMKGVPGAEPA